MYSKETLDKVREKADIVTYLESKGTPMRVTGASFVGLCPYHEEKSPSFNVRPGVQRFRCFGCGESGDIFNLVQHMETLSFVASVQFVAESVDMLDQLEEIDDEMYRKRKRLHRILQLTTEFYRQEFLNLPDNHAAKQNLANRQLLEFALKDESIGFAPAGRLTQVLLNGQENPENPGQMIDQFTLEELEEVGLVKYPVDSQGHPDRQSQPKEVFRNRLMWTVYDISGRPVGFSGRIVDASDTFSPKYLNSPQTLLYNKSRALLGLNFARKSITTERSVIVVEGQTDVMAFQAAGITNVVASCGTAFGQQHVDILTRLAATSTRKGEQFTFIFCMDSDEAGTKSVMSIFEKIPEIQMNSQVVMLKDPTTGQETDKTDPCDYRDAFGDEALQNQLQSSAVSLVEFALREELNKWDIMTPEGRSGFINAARPILSFIQDPLAHDAYLRKMSFWTGVSYSQLVDAVKHRKNYTQPAQPGSSHQDVTIDEKIYAAFLQYPAEMSIAWNEKNLPLDFFSNPEEAEEIILNLPPDSPHLFTPLNIPVENIEESMRKLVNTFLHIKYMEAVEDLNARMNSMSDMNNMDEAALLQMILEQQTLKTKYHQV